jgi:hypothetical protein
VIISIGLWCLGGVAGLLIENGLSLCVLGWVAAGRGFGFLVDVVTRVASGRASMFAWARAYWWFMRGCLTWRAMLCDFGGCVVVFLGLRRGYFAFFLQSETLILYRFQGKVHAMSFFC